MARLAADRSAAPVSTLTRTLNLSFRSPVFPAGLVALAMWLVWAARDGGFYATQWGLFGMILVLLLAVALVASPPRVDRWERRRLLMLGALAAFVGWNYLSILWADFPADAWAGADKTLAYAAGFALFAMWPWTPRAIAAMLGLFAFGVAVVGAIELVRLSTAADATPFFESGRLFKPVGYVNGNVALTMCAAWPAVYLASSRTVHPALRALLLGCAGFLLDLAVLGQSRAWLFLMPLTVIVAVLLARQRLRFLLAAALAAVSTLAITDPLLDVHERFDRETIADPTLGSVAVWIGVSVVLLALAGGAWGLLDLRIDVPRRAQVALSVGTVAVCLAGIGAGAALAVAEVDHPGAWISERWQQFTSGGADLGEGSRFTGSFESGRYAEWKVAWEEFLDHPITGIGADNYSAAYLERRTDDFREPRYPHSVELRLLSQLGVVGVALFAIVAGVALWLALGRRRRLDAASGTAVGAAVMVFAYWLVYGSQDWFWEIPALAAPALGFLALASSADPTPPGEPVEERSTPRGARWLRVGAGAAVVVVALAGAAALVVPALAASYTNAALRKWGQDPPLAYRRLERAAELNPLSAEPYLFAGSMQLRLGEAALARASFEHALEREPKNWYAYVQLAMLEGSLGDYASAERYLRRAQTLNPNDKVAARVERLIERRKPIDPNELNARYVRTFTQRFPGSLRPPPPELG